MTAPHCEECERLRSQFSGEITKRAVEGRMLDVTMGNLEWALARIDELEAERDAAVKAQEKAGRDRFAAEMREMLLREQLASLRAQLEQVRGALGRLLADACGNDNCASHRAGCRCVHHEARAALSPPASGAETEKSHG